jgi:hypothetical protein
MVDVPFSRFKLKRSASVDSIHTGLNNIISRMHFSQLLRRELDTLDDDCIIDDNFKIISTIKDWDVTSNVRRKTTPMLMTERNSSVIENNRRRNEKISNDGLNIQKFAYKQDQETKIQSTQEESRKKLPRRCSSYYDEYSKREIDRQKAREVAATLIRAHKVKKEFSDGMKSSCNFSPAKKLRKKLNRRNSNTGVPPTTTPVPAAATTPCTNTLAPKIRLHTTTMAFATSAQRTSSIRTPRHRESQEK